MGVGVAVGGALGVGVAVGGALGGGVAVGGALGVGVGVGGGLDEADRSVTRRESTWTANGSKRLVREMLDRIPITPSDLRALAASETLKFHSDGSAWLASQVRARRVVADPPLALARIQNCVPAATATTPPSSLALARIRVVPPICLVIRTVTVPTLDTITVARYSAPDGCRRNRTETLARPALGRLPRLTWTRTSTSRVVLDSSELCQSPGVASRMRPISERTSKRGSRETY